VNVSLVCRGAGPPDNCTVRISWLFHMVRHADVLIYAGWCTRTPAKVQIFLVADSVSPQRFYSERSSYSGALSHSERLQLIRCRDLLLVCLQKKTFFRYLKQIWRSGCSYTTYCFLMPPCYTNTTEEQEPQPVSALSELFGPTSANSF